MRTKLAALWNDLDPCYWLRVLRGELRERTLYRWQRSQRGYSDADLWSFDGYLAWVLSQGLRELAKMPAYKALDENYEPDPSAGPENWERLLHEMADGFVLSASVSGCDWSLSDEEQAKVQRSYDLLARFHDGLWW